MKDAFYIDKLANYLASRFEFDESLEYGSRIDEILKDITKDLQKDK